MCDLIPLSVLSLDLPAPVTGWRAELHRRGLAIVRDDLGREAISRDAARSLLTEQRESAERHARLQQEAEQRAAAQAVQVAAGVPADAIPPGVSAGEWLMRNDPDWQRSRRRSMAEFALANPHGGLVYTPINEDAP